MQTINLTQQDAKLLLDYLNNIHPFVDLDVFIKIENIIKSAIQNRVITDIEIQEIFDLLDSIRFQRNKKHNDESSCDYNGHKPEDKENSIERANNINLLTYQSELMRFRRFFNRLMLTNSLKVRKHFNKR